MNKLTARFKLWLSCGDIEGVFGDGKWRLLKAVDSDGSLRAAGSRLAISYRKAWGDLKKAQEGLNVTLVTTHRGGNTGGRSCLTAEGRKWVQAYTSFRRDVESAVQKAYQRHIEQLVK